MKRLGWYAVSAVVAAIILGSVLLLAANLYVQSQTVQQRIRQALTSTLRMPVTIRKTTVTPWEGLRIDGIAARAEGVEPSFPSADGPPVAPDFLKAESFRVRFAFWPLLHRQLVVNLLWLDKPQLAWAQDADGRWQFPPTPGGARHRKKLSADTPAPDQSMPAPPVPALASATPSATAPAATPAKERAPRRPEGFTIALDKFRLRHGSLDFLDARHRLLGQFEDVNLDGRLSDPRHATGMLTCEKANLPRPNLTLTKLHSNLVYDGGTGLTLSDGGAALAGGFVAVNGRVGTSDPDSPFSMECNVGKVDLGQLLLQVTKRLQPLEGSLQGKVNISGSADRTNGRTATGRFEMIDARLKDFPLFQTFGDALHIADLSHLQFKTARVDCRLDGPVLEIDPLLLVSNDLKITAQGRYLTDEDRLDLHAKLVIDEAVGRQLPDFIGDQFKPANDEAPGSRFIDFDMSGPLNNPKSNLYNRLVGDPMKGLLHDMFAPRVKGPKEKNPKHRADSPTPSPSPAPATIIDALSSPGASPSVP